MGHKNGIVYNFHQATGPNGIRFDNDHDDNDFDQKYFLIVNMHYYASRPKASILQFIQVSHRWYLRFACVTLASTWQLSTFYVCLVGGS